MDDLTLDAAHCERLLDEAGTLLRKRRFDERLAALAHGVSERLDAMDARLVALHPVRHAAAFAAAARLHRRLEHVQAAIPAAFRRRPLHWSCSLANHAGEQAASG